MRCLAILCLIFICVPRSQAQHQEPSLVDRLLRPNMELQNSAQGKKFAANSTITERRGTVGTFNLQPNRAEKSFKDDRTYASSGYSSPSFYSGSHTVGTPQNQSAKKPAPVGTSIVGDVHPAYDARDGVTGRAYADQHQFTERGKSQKSLDRQNPPLTIDQVRELLNKNK